MIAAIVLASGLSERFGQNKLLMPLGDQSIVEHVIDKVKDSNIKDSYLVYGNNEIYFTKISKSKNIKLIHNENFYLGQSASVKEGIKFIGDNYSGAMFLLGDQPFITTSTINSLMENFNNNPDKIIVPTYKGVRGNPVIFSREFFTEIKNIEGDRGARDIIKANNEKVMKVPIKDELENFDIDTKDDYKKALEIKVDKY